MSEEPELVVGLRGPQWRAELVVAPPENLRPQQRFFDVAPDRMRPIEVEVRYTQAHNRLAQHWQRWHVKIYRCANPTVTGLLRDYLRQQATDVQGANADLEGPDRTPIEPPWAVVPVHIVNLDGSLESLDGTVQTQLALPPEDLMRQVRGTYPGWLFPGGVPSPDLYLLAISPWMKQLNWPNFLQRPAVEQLHDFLGMGAGLDALHRRGMVHCDIKPDNVCRYHTANAAGYVLIDIDAATRLNPPPKRPRITPTWAYGRLLRGRTTAEALRAHDRFGFALVVLCALAGREWVRQHLLADLGGHQRPADSRDLVEAALRRRWQDTAELRWDPLIRAAAEPFGREIEDPEWSAFHWIDTLMRAQRDCLAGRSDGPVRADQAADYRAEIQQIRAKARNGPASLPVRVQRGVEAVEEQAWSLAVRHAAIAAAVWGGGLVLTLVLLTVLTLGLTG